jgi:arsenite-transporting ATPase
MTSVRLVLTPERVVLAETRRTLSLLALRGIRVDGLVVNRMMPAPGWWRGAAASWLRTRRMEQQAVLDELGAASLLGPAGGPASVVEHRASEPVGLEPLREISEELYGGADPLHGEASDASLLQVSEVDGGYQLRVALPLGDDSTVSLARVDDDLAVTVDGFRRLVTLPELLRRCGVTGAESDAAGVVVHLAREGGEP